MESGTHLIFQDDDGAPTFGWRVDGEGAMEPIVADDADPDG